MNYEWDKKMVKNLCKKQRFGLICLFRKYRPVKIDMYIKKFLATISRDLLKMKEKNWCTIHWQGILLRLKRHNLENKKCLATISRDLLKKWVNEIKKWLSYHSPTRNPIEAKKATMPTMVEKWQALESMLRTHTSCPRFCIKNHPEDEMQPKTIMEKNCKRKMIKSIILSN